MKTAKKKKTFCLHRRLVSLHWNSYSNTAVLKNCYLFLCDWANLQTKNDVMILDASAWVRDFVGLFFRAKILWTSPFLWRNWANPSLVHALHGPFFASGGNNLQLFVFVTHYLRISLLPKHLLHCQGNPWQNRRKHESDSRPPWSHLSLILHLRPLVCWFRRNRFTSFWQKLEFCLDSDWNHWKKDDKILSVLESFVGWGIREWLPK